MNIHNYNIRKAAKSATSNEQRTERAGPKLCVVDDGLVSVDDIPG